MTKMMQGTNPYAEEWELFRDGVKDHELKIVHDDGLYKHLVMRTKDSWAWAWEIVTWPGSLAIRGDIGRKLVFTRENDMLAWFGGRYVGRHYEDGSPRINPSYWAEKTGVMDSLQRYSPKVFGSAARDIAVEYMELELPDPAVDGGFWDPLDGDAETLLAACCAIASMFEELYCDGNYYYASVESEDDAREWAERHQDILGTDFFWDTDFNDWDAQYLYTCYAIALTVEKYYNTTQKGDRDD